MPKTMLPEQIANQLRRDILRGRLAPGSSIKERDSAAEMGVSRTPMREALRILAKEGLIELRPSRSPLVANPSIKEISDQVVVMIALEQLSAELACAHASDDDIARIGQICEVMAAEFDRMDPLEMFEIDMSFHTSVARASGNQALAEAHGAFLARLWRARYLSAVRRRNRERVVSQHRRIVEALGARDPGALREAIDRHLLNLAADIEAVLRELDLQAAG